MHDKERNGYDAKRSGRDIKVVNAYAGKAKKYVAGLIEGGEVALEFDPGNAYLNNRDKYGRLLAYVYRTKDNLFINSEIIKEGYGFSYGRFPYKYRSEFYALEKEAKRQKKGMWS
jgi:micrococcal nuclease